MPEITYQVELTARERELVLRALKCEWYECARFNDENYAAEIEALIVRLS